MTKPMVAEQNLLLRHINQSFEPAWLPGAFAAWSGSLSLTARKRLQQLWPDAAGSMG
jgi:hypothetical protein